MKRALTFMPMTLVATPAVVRLGDSGLGCEALAVEIGVLDQQLMTARAATPDPIFQRASALSEMAGAQSC